MAEILGLLAGLEDDGTVADAVGGQRRLQRHETMLGNIAVGDHHHFLAAAVLIQKRRQVMAGIGNQTAADSDLIGPLAEGDIDCAELCHLPLGPAPCRRD